MKSKISTFIIVAIVIVAGVVYWNMSTGSLESPSNKKFSLSGSTPNQTDSPVPAPTSLPLKYANEDYGFSFNYPDGYTINAFKDTNTEIDMIVMQSMKPEGSTNPVGFQISVQAIDEDIDALTVERIKQDLPDLVIDNPQDVILGSGGKGVAFISNDESFNGKSREVWFVFKRNLYQIRTYADNDPVLQPILATWQFE